MAVANALVTVLKGDTLKKFLWRGNEYKGRGFKMLTLLKDDFVASPKTSIVKEMFAFFQDFHQGDSSPNSYESNLRELSAKFAMSGNPLSKSFQVMFMVRGLCADYGKILFDFRDGIKNFEKEDLSTIIADASNKPKDPPGTYC